MRIQPKSPNDSSPKNEPEVLDLDIYRSSVDRTKLLSVPSGTNLLDMSFAADLDQDLHNVKPYKNDVHLERGQTALGLDVEDIFIQIASRGYAAHTLKVSTDIQMGVRFGGPQA